MKAPPLGGAFCFIFRMNRLCLTNDGITQVYKRNHSGGNFLVETAVSNFKTKANRNPRLFLVRIIRGFLFIKGSTYILGISTK
jgi:hypothetical protein